ncbi:MAG TPA: DUF6785 family protein [Planctomycetota bacterium]|nr:DUF6785 family protein [Planctomycetota bacterium]
MTPRAFFIGLLLLIVIVVTITYNDYAYNNTYLSGGNHFPIIAVFVVIFFALLLNPLLRVIGLRRIFGQSEMLSIWCMIAAGVGIPASGLMRYLMPFMVAPFYFSSAEGKWATTFYDFVPRWLVPSKGVSDQAVTLFYEGVRDGSIPWRVWVTPFFAWGIVLMATYLMMFCITAIIRKQWVEHERLSFPLAQIPLEISRAPEQGRLVNSLFRSPLMWIGASVPIFFWLLAGINKFYPNTPFIQNVSWPLTNLFGQMTGWQGLCIIYFLPIGVTFLLSTEISLSLWLFFILHNLQRILRTQYGYTGGSEFESRQQIGAYVAFAAIMLWSTRRHLRNVFRKAFLGADDVDDSAEALPYRASVIGLVVSGAVIVGWLAVLGCPVWVALLLLGIVVVLLLGLSRLVAQGGMLLVQSSLSSGPLTVVQDAVGNQLVSGRGLTAITFYQAPLYGDTREVLMPTLINNAKLGENRMNIRKLFYAMMLAVLVSYTVSYFSQVIGYYQFGANNSNMYSTQIYPRGALNALTASIENTETPAGMWSAEGLKHYIAGGVAVAAVSFLRSQFSWWFVHPLGILMAQTYPMRMLWVSIFIGWLCKSIAQKYARGPLMAKPRQFFLGVIIGDVMITVFWAIIGLAQGQGIGIQTFPG